MRKKATKFHLHAVGNADLRNIVLLFVDKNSIDVPFCESKYLQHLPWQLFSLRIPLTCFARDPDTIHCTLTRS